VTVRRTPLALLLCLGLAIPAAALAGHLTPSFAHRLASQGQREICEREPACVKSQIGACTRVSDDKFRCGATETYGRAPNRRICKFNAVVALFVHTFRVRDGYIRCYNPAGELVAEGEVTHVHPV
jgi:hypothetical protein